MSATYTSFDQLPDETLVDILSRVPAVALLGFRTVCRRWRAIIDHEQFVEAQHRRSIAGYPAVMALSHGREPVIFCAAKCSSHRVSCRGDPRTQLHGAATVARFVSCSSGSKSPSSSAGEEEACGFETAPLLVWRSRSPYRVHKFFRTDPYPLLRCGLVWRPTMDGVIHMVNPITEKELDLPSCPYISFTGQDYRCWSGFDLASGFYKVVALHMTKNGYTTGCIYTMGMDKSWRLLSNGVSRQLTWIYIMRHLPLYFKGRLFWAMLGAGIQVFDLATEKWKSWDTPDSAKFLLVLGNSTLALISRVEEGCSSSGSFCHETNKFKVWVLHEDSQGETALWLPWTCGDLEFPKELADISFICSLSEEHWLLSSTVDGSHSTTYMCYSVVDGTLTNLDVHFPGVAELLRCNIFYVLCPSLRSP